MTMETCSQHWLGRDLANDSYHQSARHIFLHDLAYDRPVTMIGSASRYANSLHHDCDDCGDSHCDCTEKCLLQRLPMRLTVHYGQAIISERGHPATHTEMLRPAMSHPGKKTHVNVNFVFCWHADEVSYFISPSGNSALLTRIEMITCRMSGTTQKRPV